MATNTARRKSKSNKLDLLPGSVLDESVSSIIVPVPSVPVLPQSMIYKVRDHPFKTSACLRGVGVSPWADGQKVTVYKDQKSPSQAFCWNADGKGVGVKKS